jgi:hypothetical protein
MVVTRINKEIKKFKKEMEKIFKMSDLGLLHYFLGIEVKQKSAGFILSQTRYAWKILEKAGMSECNSGKIPMEPKK